MNVVYNYSPEVLFFSLLAVIYIASKIVEKLGSSVVFGLFFISMLILSQPSRSEVAMIVNTLIVIFIIYVAKKGIERYVTGD